MKSDDLIVIVIVLLLLGIITFFVVSNQKKQILNSLKGKGAKNIVISWMPVDSDRNNHTYWVEYEDALGEKHNTTCKISIWGSSIYWEEDK